MHAYGTGSAMITEKRHLSFSPTADGSRPERDVAADIGGGRTFPMTEGRRPGVADGASLVGRAGAGSVRGFVFGDDFDFV